MPTCRTCKEQKPQEDFVKDKNRKSGYSTICKRCEADRSRARKAAMTEEEREWARRNWRNWNTPVEKTREWNRKKREKRRLIEKQYPPLPRNVLAILKEKYGHQCLKCGRTDSLQRDHVIPLSRGGPNTMENLQLLCISCNAKKATKIIDYR